MSSQLHVRSVVRAVGILEQFTLDDPELSLTEIGRRMRLSKSTTHRILSTLEQEEMVELDRRTGRYHLGLKVFRLGSVVAKSMELVKQADPLLQRLVETTDETAFLVVVDGDEALCLRRLDGKHHVRVLFMEAGKRSALNCGATQRVLLAHLPDGRWEEIVAHHVRRMTENSLMTREQLEADRCDIRERGYAISWEDVTPHACAMGAPVRDASGNVVAAISLSGIVQRFPPERIPVVLRTVVEAAEELSRRMGYMPRQNSRLRG